MADVTPNTVQNSITTAVQAVVQNNQAAQVAQANKPPQHILGIPDYKTTPISTGFQYRGTFAKPGQISGVTQTQQKAETTITSPPATPTDNTTPVDPITPVTPPVTPVIPPITPPVTPPVTPAQLTQSQLTSIESSIRNSLFGAKSFETRSPDISLIQKNITSALSVDKDASNKSVYDNLTTAQKSLASAVTQTGTDKTNSLKSAQTSLSDAEKVMNSLGYVKGKYVLPTTETVKQPILTQQADTVKQASNTKQVDTVKSTTSTITKSTPTAISSTGNVQAGNTVASNVRNALFGTGSLTSSNVHLSSVNADIKNALSASSLITNKPANSDLLSAQKSIASALGSSGSSKTASLVSAQKSLTSAQKTMNSLGYSGNNNKKIVL